jgi:hypothetical protein
MDLKNYVKKVGLLSFSVRAIAFKSGQFFVAMGI